MKIEMTTLWLPIICPGLYGTELGNTFEEITDEEEIKDMFKSQLCFEVQSVLNEIFSEDWFVREFGNVTVNNCIFKSPRFYNFENDSVEFDLEIEEPQRLLMYYQNLKPNGNYHYFHRWIKDKFGSRSGFISFYPYEIHSFKEALFETEINKEGKWNYNRAIAMLLTYILECDSNCALDSYQRDLEDTMAEYCSGNGLFDYGEDDEE